MNVDNITPVMKVKNEDWWIYYVLRDPLKMFGRFIILDTGSTDATKKIILETATRFNGDVTLISENYGDDAHKIGNSPNILRRKCPTEWMFLIDGDEIWRTEQLEKLIATEVAPSTEVVMVVGRNLAVCDGDVVLRESWNADRLFRPMVKWTRTDYPFESHELEERCRRGVVQYTDAFFWHTRHLTRSSRDTEAYFREEKRGYYPYEGPFEPLPPDWLGDIGPYRNPYVR